MVRSRARCLIASLLSLIVVAGAVPYTPRSLDLRDTGGQFVCVPVSSILQHQDDLKAKVRQVDGSCPAGEVRSSSNALSLQGKLKPANSGAKDDYGCDKDNPCDNGACCAKSGYCGYGDKYCGKTGKSPNAVCWSNCDAKAECGRFAEPKGKKCPLNVCCSPFGFCGMTEEFCHKSDHGDDDKNCQSNCDQPDSGGSGGNVQKRVIGYYEAWNSKKKCMGMKIQDIPVGSLTHIYYSFGFIKPDSYDIVPMVGEHKEDVSASTFTDFAALKRKNPSLKVIMALGGWSFNKNHTIWQPVFGDIVSSKEKRSKFIGKVEDFMTEHGFDGIDIDWEYPGATDRGGKKDDGKNLTKLLKEMRKAFDKYDGKEVSFTAPTSYWYMRNFDIKGSVAAANFVNLMSYDLHGIWDSDNPIGSHVLAHTNITEIDRALDLLWRNDIPPGKVNLGLGFYGRSFQLADPSCSRPGCLFKGGASPGPCTDNSGTLSYREIMDVIEKHNLTPSHDKKGGVKWVTWGHDQWVSFDDFDTFQQKIEFANALGLGGLLIWSIDQDTTQLDALSAVVYPKRLGETGAQATAVNNWDDVGPGKCYTTDCGSVGCKSGYVRVSRSQCSGEDSIGVYDSMDICCPFASTPDPKKCTWRGGHPYCNGRCHAGEVALASSKYGSGGECNDGLKFFCCPAEAQLPDCRWAECGDQCNSDENELTWRALDCPPARTSRFCCNKQEDWQNCKWHGKPGSCFDDHCDTGWQVTLATSFDAEGETCGAFHLERERSFCCDPPKDSSPFSPVPLEYLFENAPDEKTAHTEFDLKVDPTFGGSTTDSRFSDEPNDAPFGFVILTSPEELQVSLDKRDGSHWEVFDCLDPITEGEHTVRMTCTDLSEDSNCGKIHLGRGAPGTIIQMPRGCGPGKYAVAKSLEPSRNQTLPGHLVRRGLEARDTIYDLTFDYNFRRVPRDLGDTLIRIDYSNDVRYWDGVVDKAADTKKRRKRSLDEVKGNHRRWLEEEWRDDAHFGGLSKDGLHKRWFGEDVINWLKKMVGTIRTDVDFGHEFSEDYVLKIIDQELECPGIRAHLDVHAEAHVETKVNYGFTLIAKLEDEIDLSKSYLYFRSRGEASAKFVVDGAVTAFFDTGDVLLLSADKFGAAFAVPGIVTVGPNFKLFGQLEGSATLGVNFESRVKLADWDVRQTYPVAAEEWDPEANKDPSKDGTQNMVKPEFDYGLSLSGHISAHIKPTISFGIDFNKDFIPVDSCAVNLVADGHITFHAEGKTGSSGTSFCYGIDAGADLYATIDAPSPFGWTLPKTTFPIIPVDDVQIYPPGDSPACWSPGDGGGQRRRSIGGRGNATTSPPKAFPEVGSGALNKRAQVYGPLVPELDGLKCPGADTGASHIKPCPYCSSDSSGDGLAARDGVKCWYDPDQTEEFCPGPGDSSSRRASLKKRKAKDLKWEYNGTNDLRVVNYPTCSNALKKPQVKGMYGYDDKRGCNAEEISKRDKTKPQRGAYVTEHVYEAQSIQRFLLFLEGEGFALPKGYKAASNAWVSEVLIGLGGGSRKHSAGSWDGRSLWNQMSLNIGSTANLEGLTIADRGMNSAKGKLFEGVTPGSEANAQDMDGTKIMHRSMAGVFYYMRISEIWDIFIVASQGMETAMREFDESYNWDSQPDEPGRPKRDADQPKAGLRDLYCYWIDMELDRIEAKARNWRTDAKTKFASAIKNLKDDADATNWLNQFSPPGFLSADRFRFERARNRHNGPNPDQPDTWKASNYAGLWKTGNGYGPAGPF